MGKYSIFDCVLLQLYWCSGHLVPAWPHLSLSDPLSVIISNPTFPHSEISSISFYGFLRREIKWRSPKAPAETPELYWCSQSQVSAVWSEQVRRSSLTCLPYKFVPRRWGACRCRWPKHRLTSSSPPSRPGRRSARNPDRVEEKIKSLSHSN